MWALRVLTGSLAGQVFPLKSGRTRLGRAGGCDIQWMSSGISKEHLEISVRGKQVSLRDLRSSNGTFVNGVRVQATTIKLGDKIMVGSTLCDLVVMQQTATASNLPVAAGAQLPANMGGLPAVTQNLPAMPGSFPPGMPGGYNGAPGMPGGYGGAHSPPPPPPPRGNFVQQQADKLNDYMERVAMPGVYNLPRVIEYRFVLMGFIGLYIALLTFLSIIPLYRITDESISIESQRRALTVARALSEVNQKVLRSGDYSGFRTEMIMKEEGIEDAYVVARDGKILAPAERVGLTPKEAGFVAKLRGTLKEVSDQSLIDGKVAASVPIVAFDPELQQNVAKAYAVVVYNPGNLTFDDGRAFSLIVQMLVLAMLAGVVLFFFMYRLVQHPFHLLNKELDMAMRDGRDSVMIEFQFPALQNLLTNLNSMLARLAQGAGNDQMVVGKGSRDAEIANIMQLIGYPSLLVTRDDKIARLSPTFEALTGISSEKMADQKIGDLPDPALQQNLKHLMNTALANLSQIASDTLEIGGVMFNLNCIAIATASGDVEYFLVTVTPVATEGQEGAA